MTTTHLIEQTHEPAPEHYVIEVTMPTGTIQQLIRKRPAHWALIAEHPEHGWTTLTVTYSEAEIEAELSALWGDWDANAGEATELWVPNPRTAQITNRVKWQGFVSPGSEG